MKFINDNSFWVIIHKDNIPKENTGFLWNRKYHKYIIDQTGFYLFRGLEECKNPILSDSYVNCGGMLRRGHFNNIVIIGNIKNKQDYYKYKDLLM